MERKYDEFDITPEGDVLVDTDISFDEAMEMVFIDDTIEHSCESEEDRRKKMEWLDRAINKMTIGRDLCFYSSRVRDGE